MTQTERGFRLILWGLVFVVLDFNLGSIPLLPDAVGFLLVSIGLGSLVPWSDRFGTARKLSTVLIVLSLREFIRVDWPPLQVIVEALYVALVWLLCGGIVAVAREHGMDDLRRKAEARRGLYFGLQAVSWILTYALKDVPKQKAETYAIGLVVFSVVVMLLLMELMWRAGREFSWLEQQETDGSESGTVSADS
jgi:hypothetical protein